MIPTTTVTHRFTCPIDPSQFEKILITYKQNNDIILQKTKSDVVINEYTIVCVLSPNETILFDERKMVKIQLKVKTYSGSVLGSAVFERTVEEVLDNELL